MLQVLSQNDEARREVGVDRWHKAGLIGTGVTLVLLDGDDEPEGGAARESMRGYYTDVLGMKTEVGHPTNVGFDAHEFAPGIKILMFDARRDFDEALEYVRTHKDEIDLINVSLAGLFGAETPKYLAFEELGIPMICASGNDDYEDRISYPAAYPFTIAIGAYNWRETGANANDVADYSNEGLMLDAVCLTNIYMQRDDGYTWSVSGTSFAAPSACGMLACYIQYRKEQGLPKLTPEEARKFIRDNCVDIKTAGFDTASGYGLFSMPEVPVVETPGPAPKRYWRCQKGSFPIKDDGRKEQALLELLGYDTCLVYSDGLWKIQLRVFSDEIKCRDYSTELRADGIDNFVVYY